MSVEPLRIRRLTLKHFRSFLREVVELDNPLILVGKNGAGKSNLVDALQLLGQCLATPLPALLESRGGFNSLIYRSPLEDGMLADEQGNILETEDGVPISAPTSTGRKTFLGLRVDFLPAPGAAGAGWYAFELEAGNDCEFGVFREQAVVDGADGKRWWFDRHTREFKSNLAGVHPLLKQDALALPLLGGTRELARLAHTLDSIQVLRVQPLAVRSPSPMGSQTRISSDGSNLAQFLEHLSNNQPGSLERLCELLDTIAPGLEAVRPVRRQRGRDIELTLEFTQSWDIPQRMLSTFDAPEMSDGTLRALVLLAALFQEPLPSLLAIEEPEATIHPEALGTILDIVSSLAKRTQVVLSTHSPELLDAKWIKPENIRVVTWQKGVTHVQPLGSASVKALQEHLMGAGEQLRSNALWPDDETPAPASDAGNLFAEDLE